MAKVIMASVLVSNVFMASVVMANVFIAKVLCMYVTEPRSDMPSVLTDMASILTEPSLG